jgi:hypothetical protein
MNLTRSAIPRPELEAITFPSFAITRVLLSDVRCSLAISRSPIILCPLVLPLIGNRRYLPAGEVAVGDELQLQFHKILFQIEFQFVNVL